MNKPKIINKSYLLPFILVTALFYLWALPNNLNDILIPQFMKSFQLNRLEAGFVQSAFYLGYFALALPAAYIMDRYNYKTGLIVGLLLFACGSFLIYPAAVFASYGLFLLALFVIASGLSFLETGGNSFISVLGDQETAALRLNFSQAFNPLGAMSGVLIGNAFIFSGIEHSQADINSLKSAGIYQDYLNSETLRVIPPYMWIGIILLIWTALIWKIEFPSETETGTIVKMQQQSGRGHFSKLFEYPHFIKGIIAQFFYVGAQVGTWSFLISYIKDYMHKPEKEAGLFLFASLLVFAIGRFVSTALMQKINAQKLMGIYSSINIVLVTVAVSFPGEAGGYCLVVSSFFMSLMFPTIFATGVKGLGPNTKLGGSLIIMAIIGGAVWTPVMGFISDVTQNLALSMLIPVMSYMYLTYYAFIGSEPSGPLYADETVSTVPSH